MLWFLGFVVALIVLFGFKGFLKVSFMTVLLFYALLGLVAYSS
tara:strand:+ start:191 stop:319 length:129 start_codon:yes stop_codon:yes gene_type:complete